MINVLNDKDLEQNFGNDVQMNLNTRVYSRRNNRYMNCARCKHTHLIHKSKTKMENDGFSLFNFGKCMVHGCSCTNYVDKIEAIDEDLL